MFFIYEDDGSVTNIKYQTGGYKRFENNTTPFPDLKLISSVADEFTENENGTYIYTGSQLAAIFKACVGFGTAKNIEIKFAGGAIVEIKINYNSLNKDNYQIYAISKIGTTTLPAEVPEV